MPLTARPRRSVLYMPGANARALDKARDLDADALILDLEDAVAPDAKALARQQVVAALRAGGYGRRECVVRINALDTPWGLDDARAIARAGADAVLLPKVQSAAELDALARALDAAGAPATLPLWAMAETPLGFLRLDAIAGGHPRLPRSWSAPPTWSRTCMRVIPRNATKPCWRARWRCWRRGPMAWRSSMACTWTWTTTPAWPPPASRARPGVRWQDTDPPQADRSGQCRLRAHRRRAGQRAQAIGSLARGAGGGPGRGGGRRRPGREPACARSRTPAGPGRRDRRPTGSGLNTTRGDGPRGQLQ